MIIAIIMFASSLRMTAGGLPPSKQESTIKDIEKGGDLTDEIAGKDSQVLHETRSQKQASKKRLHEDHAEILTKDSSFTATSETTNSSVGVATRSSTRPNKRIKLSVPQSNKVGNQGMYTFVVIFLARTNFSYQTAILSYRRSGFKT